VKKVKKVKMEKNDVYIPVSVCVGVLNSIGECEDCWPFEAVRRFLSFFFFFSAFFLGVGEDREENFERKICGVWPSGEGSERNLGA